MRDDLALALQRGGIDPRGLNAIQRILLTTDGTVTDMLEAYFQERMQVVVLAQQQLESPEPIHELELDLGQPILRREILLRGRLSGRTVLHAESVIVPGRLSERLRTGLFEKQQPIGQLLLAERLETFREIVHCARRQTGPLARHFQLYETAPLLTRTYVVRMGGQGIMRITEDFPEQGM
jgi:chorismate-pyruvate lyase